MQRASTKRHLFAIAAICALVACDSRVPSATATDSPRPAATPATAKARMPTSIEEARKFVIGTWTYTGTEIPISLGGPSLWFKWVISEDGVADSYRAVATADDWGTAKRTHYEVITGKYSDTGERYYAIQVEDGYPDPISSDGTILHRNVGHWEVHMRRGDTNPFSK